MDGGVMDGKKYPNYFHFLVKKKPNSDPEDGCGSYGQQLPVLSKNILKKYVFLEKLRYMCNLTRRRIVPSFGSECCSLLRHEKKEHNNVLFVFFAAKLNF